MDREPQTMTHTKSVKKAESLMMGSTATFVQPVQPEPVVDLYSTQYLRHAQAVGVLWGVFSACLLILTVVVLFQPQWLGDTVESRGTGYFGLWQYCTLVADAREILCKGSFTDLTSILNPPFRAATVFVGLSVLASAAVIFAFLLFFLCSAHTVFYLSAWLQLLCGVFLLVGVLAFPAGWDDPTVKEVCGPGARDFWPGQCGLRWAAILAVIGVADAGVLSALAFTLATRHYRIYKRLLNSFIPYKGETNKAYVTTASLPSVSLAPSRRSSTVSAPGGVVMMPQARLPLPPSSAAYHAEYAPSSHHFHL